MKPRDTLMRALSANPVDRLFDSIDLPIGSWARDGLEARLLFCNESYLRWASRRASNS